MSEHLKNLERLRQMQAETEILRRQVDAVQRGCQHDWGKAVFNPYEQSEPCSFRTVHQGSDIWSEPDAWHTVSKPRWTQTCKKCGLQRHTEKVKTKVVDDGPDFGEGQ